ncbi:sialic acid-binding Ig-like lectin 11 isoform X10 [Myotis daubentonii]|uniref:sialic acid-binding Ig-like lectin 11 isoform X6 n=1 Tax=Myotis daubentonii TaxID=98922 RepID=UPI002872AF0C|nr:sialic acid-binding Ig-like lectin 11 isoform X6 [Myotis daubentonii]XP_059521309.1 sialic acid-binding Ig-like lectin 11 isoform X10 [Myotis daubentonii]
MVPLLLLPLLWGGSLQQQPGYELQVQKLVTVQEGLCVHVPCSFSYPWSSWHSSSKFYTYWYRQRDNIKYAAPVASSNRNKTVRGETQGRFLLADPTTNNCSLDIRDARRSDSGRYYLRMEKDLVRYSYLEKMLELQVTALTEKPHIWIREPLESGRPTQLTCSLPGACEGGRPLTFSWAGAPVYSLDPQTPLSSVLTFTPRPRNHGTRLTCQVKLQGSLVATQRTIRLNVSYAPGNLTIGVSFRNDPAFKNLQTTSLSILEGEALRLRCEADSNPPAELSWFRGSPGLSATPLSSTAILELPRVGPAKEGEFTCQARHPLGSHSVSLSLSVAYPPQLLGPSCSWEDQGLHCSCSSRAQPAPSLRWRLGAGLLEGNHRNATHVVTSISEGPWTNSSLRLQQGLSPDVRLSCEAGNVHGAQGASVLLLPGKAVPQAGAVPAALGGAGAMALLSLCVCLIFFCIVKARRRQAAGRPKVTNDEEPVMGTVTWGSQKHLPPDAPPDQAPPAEKGPLSGEPQELYYANLTFEGLKPREPKDQEATSTHEYSEVKRARQ